MPKRNLAAIRDNLQNGAPLDEYQACLRDESDPEDRAFLRSVSGEAWGRICTAARAAGFWHDDIKSPALPVDVLRDMAGQEGNLDITATFGIGD